MLNVFAQSGSTERYREKEWPHQVGGALWDRASFSLAQWVGQTGVRLQPLVDALREAVLNQGASTVTGSSKKPAAASECAVLNDGVRASNLSIDHPEQFAALIQKCGG